MKFYFRLMLIQLKSQMQYRASFFLSLIGQFITSFTSFFGVAFIFSRVQAVEGFSFSQVLLCFACTVLSFSLGEWLGGGFASFPRLLGNGAFDRALARPRSVIWQLLAPNVDFTRFGLFLQAVVVLVYALPRSGVVWTADKALVLALMLLCGSALYLSLFLLYAACAFFTTEGLEFMNIFTYGARKFGRYPFSVYGEGILRFLTFVIPLALVQYYPLLYLLGRERSALYALCPLLALPFLPLCYALFRFGQSKYKSTGS